VSVSDTSGSSSTDPDSTRPRSRRPRFSPRKGLNLLASLIRLIGVVIALVLVIYIVFVIGEANPANAVAQFINVWAHKLNLGLDNLFNPGDPKLAVAINYLIPAIIWLAAASIVANVLRRV
jgi:hypothetical protein